MRRLRCLAHHFHLSSSAKSSKDLMDICQDQSSDDLRHGDNIILRKSLNEDSSSLAEEGSPAGMGHEVHSFLQVPYEDKSEPAPSNSSQVPSLKKRKREEEEVPELEETCPGKRRRAVTQEITSGCTGPVKRKRKRYDPISDGNSSTKRRKTSFKKRVADVVGGNDNSEPAPSNSSQVASPKKRKREEEEVQVFEETCPGKRRRAARRKKTLITTAVTKCFTKGTDRKKLNTKQTKS